jgi:hypothetical protein
VYPADPPESQTTKEVLMTKGSGAPERERLFSVPAPGRAEPLLPGPDRLGRELIVACLERFAVLSASSSPPLHLVAVDGTCGNGHDTCFLAQSLLRLAGPLLRWSILAFDVQQAALDAARALLARNNLHAFCRPAGQADAPRSGEAPAATGPVGEARFLLQGHEGLRDIFALHVAKIAEESRQRGPERVVLAAAMYNLGFLPRSDRRVITRAQSTLSSLAQAAEALSPGGALTVHAYGGHVGGREELEAVAAWFAALAHGAWEASCYSLCNKPRNPEALFLAAKR